MLSPWRIWLVRGIVVIFLLADILSLAMKFVAGWDFDILTLAFCAAQVTLLGMWMAWPWTTRAPPVGSWPGFVSLAFRDVSECTLFSDIDRLKPTRPILGTAGILLVGLVFLLHTGISGLPSAVAVAAMQVVVIFAVMWALPLVKWKIQFRLWDLLVVVTLVAVLIGSWPILRYIERAIGITLALPIVGGVFSGMHALVILAWLSIRGWRVLYVGVPLAIVTMYLMVQLQIGALEMIERIYIPGGSWRGYLVYLVMYSLLVHTAIVFATLLLLRLCGVFGVARQENVRSHKPGENGHG